MASLVELKNGAPYGGGIDRANANAIAGRPASVFGLTGLQVVEQGLAVTAPGVAAEIHGLGVVVVDEFITGKLDVAAYRDLSLAILEPRLTQFILFYTVQTRV